MRTRTLGPLEVSVVGLGCNNFGRRIDADATRAVVDAALEAGVTFFDTADVYGNRGGSETILGEVLQGRRDQVVLATKWGAMLDADDQQHGTRDFVRSALDASLQRLQTDHVDLYQHHQEDKRTPLDETFGALKELVDEGKILAVGTSNYEPASLEQAARIAQELGVPYVTEQSEYSWLERDAEDELLPTCERLGLGFIPYFPLASGLLTGKVSRDRPPAEGTRLHGSELDDAKLDRVEGYRAWAEAHGVSLLDVAIGGLAAVSPVASVIAGATKPEQVRANAPPAPGTDADELAELASPTESRTSCRAGRYRGAEPVLRSTVQPGQRNRASRARRRSRATGSARPPPTAGFSSRPRRSTLRPEHTTRRTRVLHFLKPVVTVASRGVSAR